MWTSHGPASAPSAAANCNAVGRSSFSPTVAAPSAYGRLGVAAYGYELGTQFFETCTYFTFNILQQNLDSLLYAAKVARTPFLTPAGPEALGAAVPLRAVEPGEPVTASATLDDTRYSTLNGVEPSQAIAAAALYVDVPPWGTGATPLAMTASDGLFDATPDDALCDNGLFCDGAETCDPLLDCQPGSDPCTGLFCDETGDVCVECFDNGDCDDGLFCNGAETCAGGVCQPGADPCPGMGCDEDGDTCVAGPEAQLEWGTVSVGGTPVTVNLTKVYVSPVVVTSVQYRLASSLPGVGLSRPAPPAHSPRSAAAGSSETRPGRRAPGGGCGACRRAGARRRLRPPSREAPRSPRGRSRARR